MVIPKSHISGFYAVDRNRLDAITKYIVNMNFFANGYVQFEHGIFNTGEYRCGINHAHLHFLPAVPSFGEYLRQKLNDFCLSSSANIFHNIEIEDVASFKDTASSYIFVQPSWGDSFGIAGNKLESQIVRKAASLYGYQCGSNWRSLENWGFFSSTIDGWRAEVG
jgi:hypothetical protein